MCTGYLPLHFGDFPTESIFSNFLCPYGVHLLANPFSDLFVNFTFRYVLNQPLQDDRGVFRCYITDFVSSNAGTEEFGLNHTIYFTLNAS